MIKIATYCDRFVPHALTRILFIHAYGWYNGPKQEWLYIGELGIWRMILMALIAFMCVYELESFWSVALHNFLASCMHNIPHILTFMSTTVRREQYYFLRHLIFFWAYTLCHIDKVIFLANFYRYQHICVKTNAPCLIPIALHYTEKSRYFLSLIFLRS